jgi:hypothetical protein
LIEYQYRHGENDHGKKNPPVLWFKRVEAKSVLSAPTPPQSTPIQASPLISAPRPQWHTLTLDEKYRQAQAQAQEHAEAEAKSSLKEQQHQNTEEKEPNLSEVQPSPRLLLASASIDFDYPAQVFYVLRLEKYTPLFEEQEIDHETLTQMEERHFVDIDMPTGKCPQNFFHTF